MPHDASSREDAHAITRKSASNLAFAFFLLPRERRRDATVFYAFCRIIDDIGDEPGYTREQRQQALDQWRQALRAPSSSEPALAPEVRRVMEKHSLQAELLEEIIRGVEMDLEQTRYATFDELRLYCYRVASAVGLASMNIFGGHHEETRRYATDLGMALQLTNILRDAGQDAERGRIYLPLADLRRFGVAEEEVLQQRESERFRGLMEFEAERARAFFYSARAHLHPEDLRAMRTAEAMRAIYGTLLMKMSADGFRVFTRRYRISRLEKLWLAARVALRRV